MYFHIPDSLREKTALQSLPQERLCDFLLYRAASPATVETLRNFLCTYKLASRKRIINAELPRLYNKTSVHLAAEKGLTPFLRILLKHGGELSIRKFNCSSNVCV